MSLDPTPEPSLPPNPHAAGVPGGSSVDAPVIVLLGGASGTGKSVLAARAVEVLGTPRLYSTDLVREGLRRLIDRVEDPSVHYESFNVPFADGSSHAPEDPAGLNLTGFLRQAEVVASFVRGAVDYCCQQQWPAVFEGIHLLPGTCRPDDARGCVIVEAVVTVGNEDRHRRNFAAREQETAGGREAAHYHRHLPRIRRVQQHLVDAAVSAGVAVIDSGDLDAATAMLLDLIGGAMTVAHPGRPTR